MWIHGLDDIQKKPAQRTFGQDRMHGQDNETNGVVRLKWIEDKETKEKR